MASKKLRNIESAIAAIDVKAAKLQYRRAILVNQLAALTASEVSGSSTPVLPSSVDVRLADDVLVIWRTNPLECAAYTADRNVYVMNPQKLEALRASDLAGNSDALVTQYSTDCIALDALCDESSGFRSWLGENLPLSQESVSKLRSSGVSVSWVP